MRGLARVLSRVLAAVTIGALVSPGIAGAFVTFESGQVRPLALTPDGQTLLAVNTPDARLEVFAVNGGNLTAIASVPVGLEPVAVAARNNSEVWVVNLLSDSISIIDLAATPPHVVRTLLVGDEPRDVVFAGPTDDAGHFTRAFITTARLGQNLPAGVPFNLTTPGTPRALLYEFNTTNLGTDLGGTPEAILELFGDTPRALAVSPDGQSVYAAVFQSGNRTTTAVEGAVCDGGAGAPACMGDGVQVAGGLSNGMMPGGLPAPNANLDGVHAPEVGLIVKQNATSGIWEDELGRNWNNAVRFDLPDLDVFRIDAVANPPHQVDAFPHVGTILFNMVVNPANQKLYVSNTEARNEVRFEGAGDHSTTVRGDLHEARITVIDGSAVEPRHLNKHIAALPLGYRTKPMPATVKDASLSTPLDMAISSDGTLYVSAFGSSKVGIFKTSEIDSDSFTPSATQQIEVSGGGPTGLALDEANHRLYVLTRFDDAIKVIDTSRRQEVAQRRLHNPEPARVLDGRRFLYDARATSSNGEASCATCHVFADFDSLAWDLGDPEGVVKPNFNPLGPTGANVAFHPMKGPMTTQTLRGMQHQGPMHWRGDRTGAESVGDERARDPELAFEAFNVAFDSLLGRDEGKIADADMKAFAQFALEIMPPPNPVRSLDNQLTAAQARGRTTYFGPITDKAANCRNCHSLNASLGFLGSSGTTTFDNETQEFKVPQLKNAYQKVGMFGTPNTLFSDVRPADARHQGPQIRGFGFLHDGSMATIFDFLHSRIFTLTDDERRDLEQYVHAFDTTFAPIVGQQITLTASSPASVGARIGLLIMRARTTFALIDQPGAKECDLVAKVALGSVERGYLLNPTTGGFRSDRAAESELSDSQLRALAGVDGQEVTYTCVPPGEGVRLALDRDLDGLFDADEADAGTNPADPNDPVRPTPTPSPTPTPTPQPLDCVGDCNKDGRVTVDEIVRGANIILGNRSLDFCPSLDLDGDERVDVTDLIKAINAAVEGCHQ